MSPRAHNPAARWTWCATCNHRGYHTRRDAKTVRKRHPGEKGIAVYPCPTPRACSTSATAPTHSVEERSTGINCGCRPYRTPALDDQDTSARNDHRRRRFPYGASSVHHH